MLSSTVLVTTILADDAVYIFAISSTVSLLILVLLVLILLGVIGYCIYKNRKTPSITSDSTSKNTVNQVKDNEAYGVLSSDVIYDEIKY